MGNVRTEQIKRTARDLVKRFPSKFGGDFDENKKLVSQLLHGVSTKVRNQVAGYIVRLVSSEEVETSEEETTEEGQEQ